MSRNLPSWSDFLGSLGIVAGCRVLADSLVQGVVAALLIGVGVAFLIRPGGAP